MIDIHGKLFNARNPVAGTDNTAAIQAAIGSGRRVRLRAGGVYDITAGASHVTGSGLYCPDGRATIRCRMGSGGFNVRNVGTTPRYATDQCVVSCNNTDDLFIHGIDFTTDAAEEAIVNPIRISQGMGTVGFHIDASFRGFYAGEMIGLNSIGLGRNRYVNVPYALSSGASKGNTHWTGIPQLSVVAVDNDDVGGVASQSVEINIGRIYDWLFTSTALSHFGMQTDGVNIIRASGSTAVDGCFGRIGEIDGCGEPFDVFADGCSFTINRIKRAYHYALKFTHGAKRNNFRVGLIDNVAFGPSFFGSDDASVGDIEQNLVEIGTIRNWGAYGIGPAAANAAAMFVMDTDKTHKPRDNTVLIGRAIGDGTNSEYFVRDGNNGATVNLNNLCRIRKATGNVIGTDADGIGAVTSVIDTFIG